MNVGRIRKRINIESSFNQINNPTDNVYGRQPVSYSDYLKKNKKKYHLYEFGNNETSPEYLKISYMHDNEFSVVHKQKYEKRKKCYNDRNRDREAFNTSRNNSKRTYQFNTNTETTYFLDNPSPPKNFKFYPKKRNFNILSNTDENEYNIDLPSQQHYFSRLAYLNMFIEKNDETLDKLKHITHRKNDGIYDYLVNNKYISSK